MTTQTFTHPVLVIDADDLPRDHVGDHVAPLTTSGTPFSYAIIDDDRHQISWATDADGMLSTLIDAYPLDEPDDQAARRATLHARLVARAGYVYATLVNHGAQAIMAGLALDTCNILERAADFAHLDQLPTIEEIPAWTQEVPLALAAQFYAPYDTTRTAPLGNVVLLDPDTPERLLESLARLGAIRLLTHTGVDAPGHVSVATADPRATLEQDLEALTGALFVLEDDPEELDETTAATHLDDLRTTLARLRSSAQAFGIPAADLAEATRTDRVGRAELIAIADRAADTVEHLLTAPASGDTDAR